MRLYNDEALVLFVRLYDEGRSWEEIAYRLRLRDPELFSRPLFCFALRNYMIRELGVKVNEVEHIMDKMFGKSVHLLAKAA